MIEDNVAVDATVSFSSFAKPWAMHLENKYDKIEKWRKTLTNLNKRGKEHLKQLLIDAISLHCEVTLVRLKKI